MNSLLIFSIIGTFINKSSSIKLTEKHVLQVKSEFNLKKSEIIDH